MSPRHRLALVAAAAAAVLSLAGCGSSDDPAPAAAGAGGPAASGVPDECAELYPFATEAADLGDVELLPAGFPEPPVDATLCETGGAGAGQEYAAYATTAGSEEVLAAYEDALVAYDAARGKDGVGAPIVTATLGDVAVQVGTKDGGFSLVFTRL